MHELGNVYFVAVLHTACDEVIEQLTKMKLTIGRTPALIALKAIQYKQSKE